MSSVRDKSNIGFQVMIPFILPVLILVTWQVTTSINLIDDSLLPTPVAVINKCIELIQSGELQRNMSISLYRATSGLLIGGTLGLVFGGINGISLLAQRFFNSSIQMIRNIPHLALIPLVIIWLGIGENAKISLVAVGVFFPIYINTFHGIRSIDKSLIEMGSSYGLSRKKMLSKIIIPGALPSILMGFRYALGVMWTTLIVSETISSSSGIGYMETNAQQFLDMPTIFLSILIYAFLGKVSDWIALSFESILLNWQKG
ncbi:MULTISPECIES: ABC transporter permease subunit [Leuconostoc]|uniref:Aliphatic sulfonates transport permease protein SsuC n=1 Tax=Leuconostoc suionicum TaxID=1511761 RepID=A0A2N9K8Q5_9LACO|nr:MULTISPECIES: ABC transporter permease subunit [Leuconostoc]API72156.1 ABC transporter permease [Leuconostoc suionicum]MBE4728587.1 ABC transporter permease subunit [Leuconostoc suionicum]MCT4401727.1 ABC transporter permease subunit [Leuconostoc suionicum]MDI6523868.1 ABC transporter permease subunit [Leuconostoc suionicum]MDI6545033.1 ABC transporter permease subunit [Leuconostoc suionicum]